MAATSAFVEPTEGPYSDLPFRNLLAHRQVLENIVYNYNQLQGPGDVKDLPPDKLPWSSDGQQLETPPKSLDGTPTEDLSKGLKVGIIGAGVSGLFTGMIMDFLNQKIPELKLSYEILEAANEDRLGGRLYTYNFPAQDGIDAAPHNYYDVGAMRFPDIPIMERTFQLFDLLKICRRTKENPKGQLVPYYLEGVNCPKYFNDYHYIGGPPEGVDDPFRINDDPVESKRIPAELLNRDPSKILTEAIQPYKEKLKEGVDKQTEEGWKYLMEADSTSTREFLSREKPDGSSGLNFNTIEWLETFNSATGWFDQAFSETVLEAMDFEYPLQDKSSTDEGETSVNWFCIDGGAQQLAIGMAEKLTTKPEFHKQVKSIGVDYTIEGEKNMAVKILDKKSEEEKTRYYHAVVNSTTLGCLQRMDIRNANLNYGTKEAIRSLGYGASAKVAIKFKYPWWIVDLGIMKGGVGYTDLPLRVCVYPSYNIQDDKEKPSILLCSYTWAQDAQRISSLISKDSPKGEEELKHLLIQNLALLHAHSGGTSYEKIHKIIKNAYLDHHAYDWYHDPYTSGAFAYFGPSQFNEMWPDIITPSANGKLIMVGEAASAHHAWVVGALESAVRGVYQFLYRYSFCNPKFVDAMELLAKGDAKNGPFCPLPLETHPELVRHQVILAMSRVDRKAPKRRKAPKDSKKK